MEPWLFPETPMDCANETLDSSKSWTFLQTISQSASFKLLYLPVFDEDQCLLVAVPLDQLAHVEAP